MIKIKMPKRLIREELYDYTSKQYCAIGYVLRHTLGTKPADMGIDTVDGVSASRILSNLTGVRVNKYNEWMEANDFAKTNYERLKVFRSFAPICGFEVE